MRILHTADWHMNARLGRVDRAADIVRSLTRIAGYLEERQVDVMLVAGDLLRERSSKEEVDEAVAEIDRIFSPFLERGGTILAITGNHDSEVYFNTLRTAQYLTSPRRRRTSQAEVTGRFYFCPN